MIYLNAFSPPELVCIGYFGVPTTSSSMPVTPVGQYQFILN